MTTRNSKRKREEPVTHATYVNNLVEETSKYFETKVNVDNEKKYWLMKSEVSKYFFVVNLLKRKINQKN